MPMAEDVDYRAFSVFINITDYSGWLQDRMEWEIHPTIRPYHVLNPWTWLPEVTCHPGCGVTGCPITKQPQGHCMPCSLRPASKSA